MVEVKCTCKICKFEFELEYEDVKDDKYMQCPNCGEISEINRK